MEPATITVHPRFRGPDDSGNGGYVCGLIAKHVVGDAEITLRSPPPLERRLLLRADGVVTVWDDDALVAEATADRLDLDPPPPPSYADAVEAALPDGDPDSPFPRCFVCGRDRAPGDGLRLFAGPLAGTDLVAAPWAPGPELCAPEFVWAALDCPGAYACGAVGRGAALLGRLAARIERLPHAGERCVVVGWPLGEDGRKLYAGTALHGEGGDLIGVARATWIVPRA